MICEYCKHPLVLINEVYIVEDGPMGGPTPYCWMRAWKLDDGSGPYHEPSKGSIINAILKEI